MKTKLATLILVLALLMSRNADALRPMAMTEREKEFEIHSPWVNRQLKQASQNLSGYPIQIRGKTVDVMGQITGSSIIITGSAESLITFLKAIITKAEGRETSVYDFYFDMIRRDDKTRTARNEKLQEDPLDIGAIERFHLHADEEGKVFLVYTSNKSYDTEQEIGRITAVFREAVGLGAAEQTRVAEGGRQSDVLVRAIEIARKKQIAITEETRLILFVGGTHVYEKINDLFVPGFKETEVDAAIIPYQVETEDELREVIQQIRTSPRLTGAVVTQPWKIKVADMLDGLEGVAQTVGSVNQVIKRNGRLIGRNNDGDGFITGLTRETDESIEGKNVLLLGAGGAGRSIAFAALGSNVRNITVYDTNNGVLSGLTGILSSHAPGERYVAATHRDRMAERISDADVIINATGSGLEEFDISRIKPGSVVVDIADGKFLERIKASRRDVRTLGGLSMAQATNRDHIYYILETAAMPHYETMMAPFRKELLASSHAQPAEFTPNQTLPAI